ncbi:sulfatase-like hydrolase/transferase [Lignipirellula cremea]|uniref:Sulfatase n=1 Tax=Lignipirellula cremea TaxID=2528010 RepID=A0A518DPC3_9BACT|nr:sulfatase-like hydrolase/transferase [Lignipirellula cremea]QDU93676.1 Sulfatase [Lignipirellula cremea]
MKTDTPTPQGLVYHPFLIAAFGPVAVFARNWHGVMWWEFAAALAVTLSLAGVLLLGFRRVYASPHRAALAASWTIALVLGFGLLYQVNSLLSLVGVSWRVGPSLLLGCWAVLLAGGWYLLSRIGSRKAVDSPEPGHSPASGDSQEEKWTQFANIFSLLVIGSSVGTLVGGGLLAGSPVENVAAPADLAQVQLVSPEEPRDIYYLVFDRYGSRQALEKFFGYDNGPFLEGLRERGFYVAEQSHANYPKTDLSLAATLNMQYHGEHLQPKSHYLAMLENHRVGWLLKEQGYAYRHYGVMLDGLRNSPLADENYWHSPMPTEYTDILYQYSVFDALVKGKSDRNQEDEKFLAATAAASNTRPQFVYAHFLLPHYPWKFNADGSIPSRQQLASRSDRESFVEQLKFTNRRILETIDAIQARSQRPPVIILQADEGPELMYKGDAEMPRNAQLEQRSGVLSAFCFPDRDIRQLAPPTISPVNTFRLVFREYFGARMELLPDRYFYWRKAKELGRPSFGEPCQFVDVTSQLLPARVAQE